MGKKKELRNLFKESIDPRFNGVFNNNAKNDTLGKCSDTSPSIANVENKNKQSKTSQNDGFQNFISNKLAEYLDKHIKEVNKPVSENNFFKNKLERIQIFSDSDFISEEKSDEIIQQKPPRKKRKKEKFENKESFKEVAVTYEWLDKQRQLLKS